MVTTNLIVLQEHNFITNINSNAQFESTLNFEKKCTVTHWLR